MYDIETAIERISEQAVLCLGDLMLDEFVYGEVSRISPEAPAPVIAARRSETNVGGAGNVARNIASLGGKCIFVALVGTDDTGETLKKALGQERGIEPVLVRDPTRPTTPTNRQQAPIAATLRATLPAPPISCSWRVTAMTGVGASGEMRDTSP